MLYIKSYTFGEDLPDRTLVTFSDENTVVKLTSPLDKPCGVTIYAGIKGSVGDVVRNGKALVNIAGAVEAGDFLMVNADGKAIALDIEDESVKPTTEAENLQTQSNEDEQTETPTTTTTAQKPLAYVLGQVEESVSSDASLWVNINIQPLVV